MMTSLPTISQAYAFVKQDEKTRQGHQFFLHLLVLLLMH